VGDPPSAAAPRSAARPQSQFVGGACPAVLASASQEHVNFIHAACLLQFRSCYQQQRGLRTVDCAITHALAAQRTTSMAWNDTTKMSRTREVEEKYRVRQIRDTQGASASLTYLVEIDKSAHNIQACPYCPRLVLDLVSTFLLGALLLVLVMRSESRCWLARNGRACWLVGDGRGFHSTSPRSRSPAVSAKSKWLAILPLFLFCCLGCNEVGLIAWRGQFGFEVPCMRAGGPSWRLAAPPLNLNANALPRSWSTSPGLRTPK
jgi:hypothetical protein